MLTKKKEQRRKNMQAVRSRGSKIEVLLMKALWGRRLRFSKNDDSVFGKPDIVFKQKKIAVFVDSEFWHGKDWKKHKKDHKTNKAFWINKIERNIERDKKVNRKLKKEGWKVIRIWGKQILKQTEKCIEKVERIVNDTKGKNIN